ncbi:MAG TPA: hypothetical protein DCY14_09020 [Anaerolineae bacterium]|jgi:hypothetical protein|nr:hypothetical protein [Anaerolineae bacterium]HRJ55174.1 hypothetical protein [Anaerolineales bacterium]
MTDQPLDITAFLKLILDALEASKVEYLIGGAIAEWAWGEPRATQDLDIVINLPVKAVGRFSRELGKRDMLVPADIILDTMLEDRADIPLNAIHMYSGLKADVYLMRDGDELRQSAFQRRLLVDYGPPIGEVYVHSPEDLILYKLMYLGLSGQPKHARDIGAILKAKKDQLDYEYLDGWVDRLGLHSLWAELKDDSV